MRKPAHRVIVERNLCWDRVRDRLNRFKHIGKQFHIDKLQKCSQSPPYYCHYMAWRLGTWHNDHLFEYFDNLLGVASSLPKWNFERSVLRTCEYAEYWSLIWQLQVAKALVDRDVTPVWNEGPDLSCRHEDVTFYIECTSFRKSLGIKEYIADLFSYIDSNIKVEHIWWIPLSLPQGRRVASFLDELFRPYLDQGFLLPFRRKAATEYPVSLPVPRGVKNLHIFLEGRDVGEYKAGNNAQGDPDNYLDVMIQEAIKNKRRNNNLFMSRPNALAISFLMSPEFYIADERRIRLVNQQTEPNLGTELDAVLYSWCGIDEELDDHNVRVFVRDESHPLTKIFPFKLQTGLHS